MSSEITTDRLNRAYLAALVLTADATLAETAVRICLASLDSAGIASEDLEVSTLGIAEWLQREPSEMQEHLPEWVSQRLPIELQNVLRLPADLRHCFVFRILYGLSPDFCSDMLQLSVAQLDSWTQEAVCELAQMRQRTYYPPADTAGAAG
jgi:DNA-directed RNA polymerase specialized sigma24 family protein